VADCARDCLEEGNSVALSFGLRDGLRQSGIPLIAFRDESGTPRVIGRSMLLLVTKIIDSAS